MTRSKPRKIEAEFQQTLIDDLLLFGWRVNHNKPAFGLGSGSFKTHIKGNPGFPDLAIARAGVRAFIEVKTDEPKSELSEDQVAWLNALAGVTHDADWWGARVDEPNHVTCGNDSGPDVIVTVLRPMQREWFTSVFLTVGAM